MCHKDNSWPLYQKHSLCSIVDYLYLINDLLINLGNITLTLLKWLVHNRFHDRYDGDNMFYLSCIHIFLSKILLCYLSNVWQNQMVHDAFLLIIKQ
jgi:hypothetical protein